MNDLTHLGLGLILSTVFVTICIIVEVSIAYTPNHPVSKWLRGEDQE